jgi:hypothetical protein
VLARENDGANLGYSLGINAANRPYFRIKLTGAGSVTVTATAAWSAGSTWRHLGATYDGSVIRLYSDGVNVKSANYVDTIAWSADNFQVLGASFQNRWWQGVIDEAAIYNTVKDETFYDYIWNGEAITTDKSLISKEGGEELTITISGNPFTIGDEYLVYIGPLATASDESCYSGVPGNGYGCYSLDGSTLGIISPPLAAAGQATVTLCDSLDSIIAQSTIEVTERSLSSELYETRVRWPDWYQTGPRDVGNLE